MDENEARLMGVVQQSEYNGLLFDDVVPPGTSGTVTVARTGHVLSFPRSDESIISYGLRVARQCNADPQDAANQVGGMTVAAGAIFSKLHLSQENRGNWPEAVDYFFNPVWTEAEKAAEAARLAKWGQVATKLKKKTEPPPEQGEVI